MRNTEQRLKQILVDQLRVEESEIVPEANIMDDLGADSLDVVEIAMTVEREFEITIDDHDIDNIHTVKDAVDYINSIPGC